MATYKKRGDKVKGENSERISKVEQESTTAEVFNTLDERASRSEEWVIKNQHLSTEITLKEILTN